MVHRNGEPNCAPHLHCKEYNIKWVEFSSRLLILIIILFTWLLTWYNVSLDWHATQQFVWWQLIIKIPAPEADKFSEWITKEGVGGGGFIHHFGQIRYPFHIPSSELCIPFHRCKCTFFKIWTNHKPRVFSQLFSQPKNASVSPVWPFYRLKWQISLPFHILQLVKSLATGRITTHRALIPIKIMTEF